ncbi:Receptor-type tyrosine-protein phosphatase S [Aphelenchoides besseyi]|nr:Receptor-type tyrosine-protein phosphatase S [Aphelenchoides besseyi]
MNTKHLIPDRINLSPDLSVQRTASKHLKRRNGGRLPISTIQRTNSDHEGLRRRRGISMETANMAGSSKSPSPMPDDIFVAKENFNDSSNSRDLLDLPRRQTLQRSRPASTMSNLILLKRNAQKWFQRTIRDKGVSGLKTEFGTLHQSVEVEQSTAFHRPTNRNLNRYQDVVCLDETRVMLTSGPNDYIHANYISTPINKKRFICTQGPLDNTIVDFWRMIVQERTVKIVMLCNTIENRTRKCADYFPTRVGQTLQFDNYTIHCRMQKDLELSKDCNQGIYAAWKLLPEIKSSFCDHYQVLDWADRGVLPADLTLISLLNAVRLSKQPIVVHCSAGIGRSATIIMLEYLMELYELGESFEDTAELLEEIRDQRAFSIQNHQQYLFVHRIFLEYLYRQKVFNTDQVVQIRKFVRDYIRATKPSN